MPENARSDGRFVSAVHVSNNLGLPFDGLKQEMLSGSSLGQAIQKLKPGMPKQEVEREMTRADLGGHPKPAIEVHLKTGHRS